MFLIVFVTLVISIVGLYAQVLSLQSAKAYNSEAGLMQTMATWHGSAVALARAAVAANPAAITPTPCSITSGAGMVGPCSFGTLTSPVANQAYLPPGYNTTNFSFYTIAYQTGVPAVDYVVTFAHDADPLSGDLYLPTISSGNMVGYTMNDLMRQFANSALPYATYGSVNTVGGSPILAVTTPGGLTPTISYTLPSVIPSGSLALISAAQ